MQARLGSVLGVLGYRLSADSHFRIGVRVFDVI